MPSMDEKAYADLRRNLWILKRNMASLNSDFTEPRHYVQRMIKGIYSAITGLEKIEEIRQIPELKEVVSAEDRFFRILPFGWLGSSKLAYRDIKTGLHLVIRKAEEISVRELPEKDLSKKETLAGVLRSYRKERDGILDHEYDFTLPDVWYKVLLPRQREVGRLLEALGETDPYLRYDDSFMEAKELLFSDKEYKTDRDLNYPYKELRLKSNLTGSLERIDKLQALAQESYGISDAEIGIIPKVKPKRKPAKPRKEEVKNVENLQIQQPFTKTIYVRTRPEIREMEESLFKDMPKTSEPSDYHAKFTRMDIDSIDNIVGEISLRLVQAISASKEKGGLLEIHGPGWEFEDLYSELKDLLISSQYSQNEKNLKVLSEVSEILDSLPKYRNDPSILFDPMRVSLYHIRMATNRYKRRFDRKMELERMRKESEGSVPN
jgi:hypothetical protein